MTRTSAGLLLFRRRPVFEVLLVHPGGPYFRRKDAGSWTIPKGEAEPGEELLAAAVREFEEETGFRPAAPYIPLSPVSQKSGKVVHAWAFEGDCDPNDLRSNTFALQWPPRSGRTQDFPEIDRAAFFDLDLARAMILAAQRGFLDELETLLDI